MPRLFDRYVFVDWSAAAKPSRGKDSIWFACGTADAAEPPQNVATRAEATEIIRQLLLEAAARGERVLVGFDFSYGFPAGFAAALRLSSAAAPWRATWALLSDCMHDSDNNANQRFRDAARLNTRIGSPPGPFWGHPHGFADAALTWRVTFPFRTATGHMLAELRQTERHLRNRKRTPFPVWKLAGQGAVGSQTLLGIRRIATLRGDPVLTSFSRVWPFETGFTSDAIPTSGPFVLHAEIWPGVLEPDPDSHPVADARQVLALVRWAQRLDGDDALAGEFLPPGELTDDQLAACIREEGWTLGATNLGARAADRTPAPAPEFSDAAASWGR